MKEKKFKEISHRKYLLKEFVATFDYITKRGSTVASQEESSNNTTGESSPSALFTKFGGSLFGAATGSPQKVVTNIRGFLSNRLPGTISIPSVPDTGKPENDKCWNWIMICLKILFGWIFLSDSHQYFFEWTKTSFCQYRQFSQVKIIELFLTPKGHS